MSRLKVAFLTLLAESILVGAILTFIGIVFVMKKNKPLFFASLSLVIFNALLVIAYGNENDQFILYRYLLPRMFLGTVIMAYGLLFLQKYAKKYVAVFFIVPLLLLGLNFQPNNNRSNFIVSDFAENIFSSSVPNNSIILTSGDLVTMPLWYLQEVENKNRNITVIDTNLIPVEWYAKSLHEKYPKLAPKNFESIPHTERVLQFIEHNISKKPIFVFGNLPTHQQYQLIPHGLLHQIKMIDENASVENISKINKKLWDDYIIRIPKKDWKKIDPLVYEVTRIYDKTLNNLGVWYSKQQMFDEMVWAWKKALEINPGNIIVQENLENFKNRK